MKAPPKSYWPPDEPVPFWRRKGLYEMTKAEWESLCDGCGQCCRLKLEDAEDGEILVTDIACRLLDLKTCRCSDYAHRQKLVPGCTLLEPGEVADLDWLPDTCGYRLVAAGYDLYWWHPLISGDPETVHEAGISARGEVVSEGELGDVQQALANLYGIELLEGE